MADVNKLIEDKLTEMPQIDLSWSNLECSVKTKQGTKSILKGISGHAFHNEFLVIMGSSGAGKTTLLNILSNRLLNSKKTTITGEILANNQPISSIPFSGYIGYVTQEDFLIETMTVYESLMFVAKLKTRFPDKKAKVLEIIEKLKLVNCKNAYIGGPYLKGISGGEKKRTSIALELITNPSILFLDEPTSGLDSYTAKIVCKILLAEANSGKAVISTIHQPSSDIFHMFQKLMLMCDGKVVYHGLAKDSIKHFAKNGFSCPSLLNPADYFMEVLFISNTSELTKDEQEKVEVLVEANSKLQDYNGVTKMLDISLSKPMMFQASISYQFMLLFHRNILRMIRNPIISAMKIGIIILIGILVMFFYWDTGTTGVSSMVNRNGLIFFNVCCVIFSNLLASVLTLPVMRKIMIKEYQSNTYGLVAYFFSYCIADLLVDIFLTVFFVSITYWSANLNTSSSKIILEYYVITYLGFYAGGSLGMMFGCVFDSADLALATTSALLFPFIYFAGFYRSGNLPKAVKWIEYLSLFFYLFEAYMKNQYEDGLTITRCYPCEDVDDGSCMLDCDPLKNFDVKLDVNVSILMTAVFCVACRGIAYLFMFTMVKTLKES